jgi:hypothetical protein
VDPLHVGINTYMQGLFKQYPAGNDPKSATDGGLNFSVLRFNAPQKLDNRAYVARTDFNLDSAGRHTLMLRGTLAGNSPGQQYQPGTISRPTSRVQDPRQLPRPRGSVHCGNFVPLVNVLGYGYTRLGTASTGNDTVIPPSSSPPCSPLRAHLSALRPLPRTSSMTSPGLRAATPCSLAPTCASWRVIAFSFNNLPNY